MAAKPKTGLGKTWLQGDRKPAVRKKTRQGDGRGSKPSHGRKASRGQG